MPFNTKMSPLPGHPKTPLAFRVEIIRHQPNRLKFIDLTILSSQIIEILVTLREQVGKIDKTNREIFIDNLPVLRAITT